jgi:hypothetical protein
MDEQARVGKKGAWECTGKTGRKLVLGFWRGLGPHMGILPNCLLKALLTKSMVERKVLVRPF